MANQKKEELAVNQENQEVSPKIKKVVGRPKGSTKEYNAKRRSLGKRIKVLEAIIYNDKEESRDRLAAIRILTQILGDKIPEDDNNPEKSNKIVQKLEEINRKTKNDAPISSQIKPITKPIKAEISKIANKSDVFEADFLDDETLDNAPIKESENVIKPNNSPIKDNENIIGANNSPITDINDTIKLCADENSVMDNVIKANENTINKSADVIKEEPNTIKPNDSTIKDNDSPIKEEIIELFFEVKVDDDKSNDPFLTEEE